MMHFLPGLLCTFRANLDVWAKQALHNRLLCGCKMLVAPLCLRPKSQAGCYPQGKSHEMQRAVLEGRGAHLAAAISASAAAKAWGQESSFLPVVLRSFELSLHIFMCRWSYSCSCTPETFGDFCFSWAHALRGELQGPSPRMKQGLRKKEELLGL